MENQHVINMLGITNQQVYNNRRDINNLMELWTTIRDQLSGGSGRTPVYNPMIATLNGGGFSITNIQDLVANGSGTFGGTLSVSGATSLGSSLTVSGATNLNNSLTVTGQTVISNATSANSVGSGAHVVQGGASVTLDFYVGQDLNVTGNTALAGTLDVYGITTINNSTPSTTSTNGALIVTGGAGIGLNLNVGGSAAVTGTLTVEQATQLNSDTDMHSLVRAHGTGDAMSTGPTTSTAVKIMSGGMSVAKSVYIGNNLYINQNANVTGTLTVSDATTLDSTLSVGSNATVTGSLTVNANTFLGATNTNTLTVNAVSTFLNNVFISSGDLIVQPGSSFLNDLVVNGASTFVGLVTTNNATVTGTLTVTGFTNLQDTLTVASNAIITSTLDVYGITTLHTTLNAVSNANVTGTLNVYGITTLHNTLNAVSNANVTGTLNVYGDTILGATDANTLTVNAPATFQESVRVNGQLYAHNGAQSISTSSGALIVNGGVGIGKHMYLGGHLHAQSSTQSTNTGNGAFILSGGAGIARNVNIGGALSVTGNTTLSALTATTIATAANNTSTLGNLTVTTLNATSTAVATNTTSGSITTLGGVGIAKNVYIGSTLNVTGNSSLAATTCSGQLRITDTTNVSFTYAVDTLGAVIVDGGVGIKQDLLVNGYIFANGQTTEPYAIRAGGQIAIQYDMGTNVPALSTNQGLELYNENGSNVTGKESMIAFYNKANSSKTSRGAISAGAQAIGTDCSGYLDFYTNGNTVNSLTRRMRLTSEGYLAIGSDIISNAAYHLDVNSGSENTCARFASTGPAVRVLFTDSTGTSYIEARNDFRFGNNSSGEFMRISSDGNVSINTTDSTYRLQINTDSAVSDDGIRLLVGNPGDGLTIKKSTTPVAFIGEANATPTDGGQLSLFNNSGTEDIRLMNAGGVGTDVRYNWIRTVSTNSRLIIGEFTAAPSSVHSNTYSGVTITGNNPSLALTATTANGWSWLQYINASGTSMFSSGVNHTQPQYIIKYGSDMDAPFAVGVNTSQQVTIAATSGSVKYYGHLTIQSAASGTFTTNSNDGNYGRVALALSQEVDVTDQVGSAILWTQNGGRKVAAISNYFYGDVDQSGLAFFVQGTSSGSSAHLAEAMRIDNNGKVYIGNTLNGVAEDTRYTVNIARGTGGSGNLVLQGDNHTQGAPRLAFKNELTPLGPVLEANIALDSSNQIVTSSPFQITTGTSGNNVNVTNQSEGTIIFTNGSGGTAVPNIVSRSNTNTGLVILTSTPETPTSGKDLQFNVVNNSGTAHAVTTQTAYSFNAVGSELLSIRRNGAIGLSSNYGLQGEVLTSQGPNASPTWAAPGGGGGGATYSAGVGVSISASNEIRIGQAVGTGDDPTFGVITANEINGGIANISIELDNATKPLRFNAGHASIYLTMQNDELNCWNGSSASGLYLNYNGGQVFYSGSNLLSDDRVKFNETNITNGLEVIRKLSPEKYTKRLPTEKIGTEEAGFIAQEVMAIPELKFAVKHPDKELIEGDPNTRYYAVAYDSIFTYAVAGLKELDTIVQQQAQLISSLEARLSALEREIDTLKGN